MSEDTVTFNLELNVEQAVSSVRKIEFLLFRAFRLWGRICRALGVPEDSPIMVVTERIQKLIMLVRVLHTSFILLNAASGPIGWAMAGIGVGTAVMTMADTMTALGE